MSSSRTQNQNSMSGLRHFTKVSALGKTMDRLLRKLVIIVLMLLVLIRSTYSNNNCTSAAVSVSETEQSSDETSSDLQYQDSVTPDAGASTTLLLVGLLALYDDRLRPPSPDNSATQVRCNIIVISMDSVTEVSMDFSMTILLQQYWNDPRLAYANKTDKNIPYITSGHTITSKIWVPDLFFANEKRATFHDVTVKNRLIRLYPNGDLFYSMKLSLVLYCHMDFKAFPMDKQKCRTVIESYQNTEDELLLRWNEPEYVYFNEVSLPQYSMLPDIHHDNCTDHMSGAGNFSCIEFSFVLVRELTFYVLQTYIPTSLLVFISWVSFWIEIGQAPARCSLGVTTILTMTTTTVGYGSSAGLPKVSYTKAIDIWFDACLTFVIGSLVEYAVVHYLWTRDRAEKHLRWALRKESTRLGQNGNRSPLNGSVPAEIGKQPDPFADPEKGGGNRYSYQTAYRPVRSSMHFSEDPEIGFPVSKLETGVDRDSFHEKRRSKLLALRIDRAARLFFPVCYGAFVVIYWSYYSHIYMKSI